MNMSNVRSNNNFNKWEKQFTELDAFFTFKRHNVTYLESESVEQRTYRFGF